MNEEELEKQYLKFTIELEGPEKGIWSVVCYDNYSPGTKDILVQAVGIELEILKKFTQIVERIDQCTFKFELVLEGTHSKKVNFYYRQSEDILGNVINPRHDLN